MSEKPTLSLKQLTGIVSKHHSFIFIIVVCLALAAAIYSLYDVLALADANSATTTSTISGFDQDTINKIKNLHDSSDATETVEFPSPRYNPFVEN